MPTGGSLASVEPRWPALLAILAVAVLLLLLPARVRLLPTWAPALILGALMVPMAGVYLTRARAPWPRLERAATLFFFVCVGAVMLVTLGYLIRAMVLGSREVGGMRLLTSSISVWVTNVLIFSLMYWQLDCGGPEARANGVAARVDWQFPRPDAPPDWHPTYVDYLFLSFTCATAFSPTDALPVTPRAKLLMMLESSIALATIVVVAARAINILGS